MNILSLIYSIPTNGQPPLPTGHSRPESPSSETSRDSQPTVVDDAGEFDRRTEGRRRAPSHQSVSSNNSPPMPHSVLSASSHGSGVENINGVSVTGNALNRDSALQTSRQAQNLSRLRSPSNLPPRPPCPSNLPPSTPSIAESRAGLSATPPSPHLAPPTSEGSRSRGNSVGHRRTSSGRGLEVLEEEAATPAQESQRQPYNNESDTRHSQANGRHTASPPLPALPSPSSSDQAASATPRGTVPTASALYVNGDSSSSHSGSRPRNGSSFSDSTGSKPTQRLINDTPGMGTILQRREKNKSIIPEGVADGADGNIPRRLNMNMSTPSTGGRSRALSYPVRPLGAVSGLPIESGQRPSYQAPSQNNVQQTRKPSLHRSPQPSHPQQQPSFPPSSFTGHVLPLVPPPPVLPGQLPTTPSSPLPPMPPKDALRRPYHLMNLLGHTMSSKSGGYITRKLHVPYDVWSQGGAKLTNLPEKIRVVDVLCDALTELQFASVEFAGPMSVASGMGMGVGSITRKDGEIWASKLEEFSVVCDNVVSSFGKKLSVGEGFVVKKSSGVRIHPFNCCLNLTSGVRWVPGEGN